MDLARKRELYGDVAVEKIKQHLALEKTKDNSLEYLIKYNNSEIGVIKEIEAYLKDKEPKKGMGYLIDVLSMFSGHPFFEHMATVYENGTIEQKVYHYWLEFNLEGWSHDEKMLKDEIKTVRDFLEKKGYKQKHLKAAVDNFIEDDKGLEPLISMEDYLKNK